MREYSPSEKFYRRAITLVQKETQENMKTSNTSWSYSKVQWQEKEIKTMRLATENDLCDIVAIYNTTVPTRQSTADTVEVTVASKSEWFRQHVPGKRPLLVHEQDGKVIAWVSFQSFYGRPAYDHTAEVSIYISPEHRGHGLGRKLLAETLEMTHQLSIKTVVGFVFSHNEPSIRLLKSFGFSEWGKLPNVAEMDDQEYSLSILGKRVNP